MLTLSLSDSSAAPAQSLLTELRLFFMMSVQVIKVLLYLGLFIGILFFQTAFRRQDRHPFVLAPDCLHSLFLCSDSAKLALFE